MAVTRRTIRLSKSLRVVVNGHADRATRQLVAAWAKAWDEIEGELRAAAEALVELSAQGEWPTRQQIRRLDRAEKAMGLAAQRLRELAERTGVVVIDNGGKAAQVGADFQARLIASQMPKAAGSTAELVATFSRLPTGAVDAIVARTTQQVTALSRPLSAQATNAMERALIRGVALGKNPKVAADEMVDNLEGAFNGGLTRALTIARTEILDAYRAGAKAAQDANADVLVGWIWQAELDETTCEACWAMDGTMHDLDEDGPEDHQNGRCDRLPVTKSWADLGFSDIEEPEPVRPTGEEVFADLSRDAQLAIMGPTRLAALEDGSLTWDRIATKVQTVGWRDSYRPARLGRPRFRHYTSY